MVQHHDAQKATQRFVPGRLGQVDADAGRQEDPPAGGGATPLKRCGAGSSTARERRSGWKDCVAAASVNCSSRIGYGVLVCSPSVLNGTIPRNPARITWLQQLRLRLPKRPCRSQRESRTPSLRRQKLFL